MQPSGNDLTRILHLATSHELQRMHVCSKLSLKKIVPGQNVLLDCGHGKCERQGKFDFLVLTSGEKTIGFEVLARPSQGKMKEKLSYAKEVDEFVFVLPENSLELYRKKSKKPFRGFARQKFLGKEFSGKNIMVWLANACDGTITLKGILGRVFNVLE